MIRWLRYWSANAQHSYELVTKQGGVIAFAAPIASVLLSFAGASTLTQSQAARAISGIGGGLLIYFAVVMLFVTPARMWRDLIEKTTLRLVFIDHPDNVAYDRNSSTIYERVTVKNLSPTMPLTNVEVVLLDIAPLPPDFFTVAVPLHPMHATSDDGTKFNLPPLGHKTVDVADFGLNSEIILWHHVAAVPDRIPAGKYIFRLAAYAHETTPAELRIDVDVWQDSHGTRHVFDRSVPTPDTIASSLPRLGTSSIRS